MEPALTEAHRVAAAQSGAVVMSKVVAPDQGCFRWGSSVTGAGAGQQEVRVEAGHGMGQCWASS